MLFDECFLTMSSPNTAMSPVPHTLLIYQFAIFFVCEDTLSQECIQTIKELQLSI